MNIGNSTEDPEAARTVLPEVTDRSGSSSGGLDAFYLPNTIHGPHNNTYVQTMVTSQYAEYQCEETKELIKIPNGRISASHARSADGEYFWW